MARNHLRQGISPRCSSACWIPTGGLLYINGGHNPPSCSRADGRQTLLPPTGPAVGILADSSYTLGHIHLAPGDALFAYTDGVVEARNRDHRLYGMPRLLELLGTPGPSAEGLLDSVDSAVRHFVGTAEQSDDITTLALRRTPI